MKLKNKKIAILIEKMYEDLEAWYPYYRLKEEGAQVFFVGPEKGISYPGKYGYPATSDLGIGEINTVDFDGVIIPGGYAPDHIRRVPAMIEFVRHMGEGGKVVGSICHGGWILASASLLKGKKVTGFFAIKDDLVNAGGEFIDKEVVIDGSIITSRKPSDLPAFCRTIIETLQS